MKNIIKNSVLFMIGALIAMPLNYLLFLDTWKEAFIIYESMSIAYFIALILLEYITIKNIKKLFFLVRYKRVKQINYSCEGCILNDNNRCKRRDLNLVDKCSETRTIFAKRSFNIFSWIKKLFTLLLICTLLSSCNVYLNCNINKTQQLSKRQIDKHNKQAEKQTKLQESIWY